MFKTQDLTEITDILSEKLSKSHNSDNNFLSFVNDFHNQIDEIKEKTLEKTITKVYGTGSIASLSECPKCNTKLQDKGLKKKDFI